MEIKKTEAKQIAQSGITYGQVKEMLRVAYKAGAVNDSRAKINKTMSRTVAFNIFWKATSLKSDEEEITGLESISPYNALREFGEYWTGWRPEKKKRARARVEKEYHHEEAIDPDKEVEQERII